jgi:hypothetical protein
VTFVGDANSTNGLVSSDAASNPQGVTIAKKDFPVMLEGWSFRIRDDLPLCCDGMERVHPEDTSKSLTHRDPFTLTPYAERRWS